MPQNFRLSALHHYTPRILSLSAPICMSRIGHCYIKFTGIVGTEKKQKCLFQFKKMFHILPDTKLWLSLICCYTPLIVTLRFESEYKSILNI